MENGIELILGAEAFDEGLVADVAVNGGQRGVLRIVLLKVDTDDPNAAVEKPAFEDAAKKAGTARYECVTHKRILLDAGPKWPGPD
jgi:hypothetical protein